MLGGLHALQSTASTAVAAASAALAEPVKLVKNMQHPEVLSINARHDLTEIVTEI